MFMTRTYSDVSNGTNYRHPPTTNTLSKLNAWDTFSLKILQNQVIRTMKHQSI